jgi:hypothetical protein
MNLSIPSIIHFNEIGSTNLGFIAVAEVDGIIPFKIERIYWTYYTPNNVTRGHHAHLQLSQVLIAMAGTIDVTIETLDGKIFEFKLDQPNIGLYVPRLCWRTMKYSHNAVQICFASMVYNEQDYIRNYNDFINLKK